MSSKVKQNHLLIALSVALFAALSWMLGINNGFLMDDYTVTIIRGVFENPTELFSLLPQARYNDRPVGRIFVGFLYQLFGTNAQGYHYVLVLIHLFNVFLVWHISKKLFSYFSIENPSITAFISAAIFGAYPKSIMAPQWIAAIYDLSCCFFVLCSLYYFIKKDERDFYVFDTIMVCITYMLSLRCKEMSILLPIVYMVLELILKKNKDFKYRISIATKLCFVWMILYLIRLFSLPAVNTTQYQQNFTVISLFDSLIRYIFLYFDLNTAAMMFTEYDYKAAWGCIFLIAMIIIACISFFKNKKILPIISFFFVGCMLAPVLTMDNMQHILYLYIPSIFLAIAFSACISDVFGNRKQFSLIALCCILFIAGTNYMLGPKSFRNWWCSQSMKDKEQIGQIYRLGNLPELCNIYVRGADKEYNVIYPYGPGNSVKLLYGRNDIKFQLVDEFPTEPSYPYVFWDYKDGVFTEIERNEGYRLTITNISYTQYDDENIAIGVKSSIMNDNIKIVINGQEYQTVVGDTFISTTYPHNSENGEEKLSVKVVIDDLDISSEEEILIVN